MERQSIAAYQFYPGDVSRLRGAIKAFLREEKREEALGIMVPHAGYVYSGKVAGMVYSRVKIPEDIILLGPNHTGYGERVSVYSGKTWKMPFGDVEVNNEIAELITDTIPFAKRDEGAHLREHSLEVQIPFLQYLKPSIKIAPITLMYSDLDTCLETGRLLAEVITAYSKKVLIVISSDMNHYESHEITKSKDKYAIDEIIKLNPEGLWKAVRENDISMCGIVPALVGIKACLKLGAGRAQLIDYMTSGDTSGDYSHVVGYAGIVIN